MDFPVLVQAASVPVSPVVRNSSWKAAVPAAEHMIGAGTELLVRRDALLLALPAAGQSFLRDRLDTRLFPLNSRHWPGATRAIGDAWRAGFG